MSETKEKAEKPVYGVAKLAEDLGIEPASVRVALRNEGIEKPGKRYEWPNKTEYSKVLSQLKNRGAKDAKKPAPKKSTKKDEDNDE
ncbi:MAG: hypothetical protein E6R03_01000 [Hyphomicrobiaceae bacterium]|nr:MAG: hypothetical protein E6R03_01000 [Hyphomicrobiaceae bacterium]